MRTTAARRERFFPYRYVRGGVRLRVSGCELDGQHAVEVEAEAPRLELDVPWDEARIDLELTVDRETCAYVGATVEELELLVVIRCGPTFLRVGERVPLTSADQAAVVKHSMSVRRDALRGTAEIQAFLVRRTPAAETTVRGRAASRGARVADSRVWELLVDRRRERRGEHLEVRYRKFSSDEALPAHDRRNVYALDLDQDDPILWINADHERIAGILDSKGNTGRQARLREVFFDQIAHSVWTQLFLRAARSWAQNEELVYPWEESVLEVLLRDVYPEVKSASDRLDRLADDWSDATVLLRRLDAGLQRRHDLAGHLLKLVEEQESG